MSEKLDQDKLLKILEEKWHGKPCYMCGEWEWLVSNKVFELREFNYGDLILSGTPIQPIVSVTCQNCGNTIFINALAIGVLNT